MGSTSRRARLGRSRETPRWPTLAAPAGLACRGSDRGRSAPLLQRRSGQLREGRNDRRHDPGRTTELLRREPEGELPVPAAELVRRPGSHAGQALRSQGPASSARSVSRLHGAPPGRLGQFWLDEGGVQVIHVEKRWGRTFAEAGYWECPQKALPPDTKGVVFPSETAISKSGSLLAPSGGRPRRCRCDWTFGASSPCLTERRAQ